jgi:hypothetical protein
MAYGIFDKGHRIMTLPSMKVLWPERKEAQAICHRRESAMTISWIP